MRPDHFSESLATLDSGGVPDSAADAGEALLTLAQSYAYVFPSESALAVLAGLGPLVEIGAGTGYWAHRLRSKDVDIVALDQAPPNGERANRYHPQSLPWTHVEQGDQTALAGHADRSLFLCWPPLFSSLGDCLTHYRGNTVAVIGDEGYRTARLDQLREAFTKVAVAPIRALDPHPDARPQLTIWRRTPASPAAARSFSTLPSAARKCGNHELSPLGAGQAHAQIDDQRHEQYGDGCRRHHAGPVEGRARREHGGRHSVARSN